MGGISIFSGFLFALLVLDVPVPSPGHLLLPAGLLLAVGVVDDFIELSYKLRFAAQVGAALLMAVGGGPVIVSLGDLLAPAWSVDTGMLAIPLTVVCVVGLANAYNLIDGTDGLAGSLSLVALCALGARW